MADKEPKLTHLEEVKLDAEFNFKQRLAEQKARDDFEASKREVKTPSQVAEEKSK